MCNKYGGIHLKKIKILATETTKKDEIVKPLIGTIWSDYKDYNDHVIINCCGGIKLKNGEYETI